MTTLVLDSSADLVFAALVDEHGVVLAETIGATPPARSVSEGLLPLVERVLRERGMTLENVSQVAVATGPGSFNGIRGGIAVAEGLSMSLGVPAVGVPTLDVLACAADTRHPVCALIGAGRDEAYHACYDNPTATLDDAPALPYGVGPINDIVAGFGANHVLAVTAALVETLSGSRDAMEAVVVPSAEARAMALASLATARAAVAGFDAAASRRPLYLRRPGITQPKRSLSAL